MCLITFGFQTRPGYRLILAANRDEYHDRPAEALHWWPDRPEVLAGRDLQAGGTWLAVSRAGRFATVTNYRETLVERRVGQSRGDLVTGFVAGAESPLDYCGNIAENRFAGFSLLVAAGDQLAYMSNRGDAPRALTPGVYALSNASLDTPWNKVLRSKEAMRSQLTQASVDVEMLFALLLDRTPSPGTPGLIEGLSPELARAISAPFIITENYGTRCSTVLLIEDSGRVDIYERRFDRRGIKVGEHHCEFQTG